MSTQNPDIMPPPGNIQPNGYPPVVDGADNANIADATSSTASATQPSANTNATTQPGAISSAIPARLRAASLPASSANPNASSHRGDLQLHVHWADEPRPGVSAPAQPTATASSPPHQSPNPQAQPPAATGEPPHDPPGADAAPVPAAAIPPIVVFPPPGTCGVPPVGPCGQHGPVYVFPQQPAVQFMPQQASVPMVNQGPYLMINPQVQPPMVPAPTPGSGGWCYPTRSPFFAGTSHWRSNPPPRAVYVQPTIAPAPAPVYMGQAPPGCGGPVYHGQAPSPFNCGFR